MQFIHDLEEVMVFLHHLDKFRLYFEHNQRPTKDISLVIGINDNREVKFVTVMETYRNQRVRK